MLHSLAIPGFRVLKERGFSACPERSRMTPQVDQI